jgi:malate synthase
VPIAKEVFDRLMPQPNQIDRQLEGVEVTAADLLSMPQGDITEVGLRSNIKIGIQYLEAWLNGNGCVPLYHLMEDAATAEISRSQVWQWLHHRAVLSDGRQVTPALFEEVLEEEMQAIESEVGSQRFRSGKFQEARDLFSRMILTPQFIEFLTLPAYDYLSASSDKSAN